MVSVVTESGATPSPTMIPASFFARLFRQLGNTPRADEFAQRLKQEYPRSTWLTALAQPSGS